MASKLDEIRLWMDQLREERSRMLDEMIESKLSGLDTSSAEYLNELYQLAAPLMADLSKYGLLLDVTLKMKSFGKNRLNVPIAEGTSITMGEMILFWEIMVYNGYKKIIMMLLKWAKSSFFNIPHPCISLALRIS